jgi:hypothetical protein
MKYIINLMNKIIQDYFLQRRTHQKMNIFTFLIENIFLWKFTETRFEQVFSELFGTRRLFRIV